MTHWEQSLSAGHNHVDIARWTYLLTALQNMNFIDFIGIFYF